MIYLDYAATTPMLEESLDTYVQAARTYYGNEQSLHDTGSDAAALLKLCRSTLAKLIGGEARGIYFTSGGSESNYLALHSLLTAHEAKGRHIVTTPLEHASIRNYFQELAKTGYDITYLPVDAAGCVDLSQLEQSLREDTVLVSIQHANSEIGTIQPIARIGKLLKEYGILFHTDCVQTFGKLPIQAEEMGIDSLSISAHKLYGPKGVGACYISPRVCWKPLFDGTSHENGFRPGTVNVPGIAAFLTAAQYSCQGMTQEAVRMQHLRKLLLAELAEVPSVSVLGHPEQVLPHIAGLLIHGMEGQYTMLECNRRGIAISVGSACQIGKQEPSRAILALGRTAAEAKQYVRLSFGRHTTEQHIREVAASLQAIIHNFFGGAV
ncbi:IscS subfamily cysteine desulfurase [Ectobacillus ponti]|uniref:IscS subfamily cysteine desulfurase n=1 Tax=Ectobacillus ponti TaxID=2961894 RepID=A0AA41X8F0_9BACI|nr:IscS subfamily cysteine desulfurase [Ectobacillus ponti]MCP8967306.1 IscS subfamily cysteine desulfurase [Ectobacillus ponti]